MQRSKHGWHVMLAYERVKKGTIRLKARVVLPPQVVSMLW